VRNLVLLHEVVNNLKKDELPKNTVEVTLEVLFD
jgi:hypothetical protein